MISLNICGVCNGCWDIDLKLKEATFQAGDQEYKLYQIDCTHAHVCGKLLGEMKSRRISVPEEEE